MANDEREEERAFLAGLKARTGRDLAEWMAAIAAQGFHDKNEIIDWLRTQGLTFARASWLERIHRNGGKPIHGGLAGSDPAGPTPGQSRPSAAPAAEARPVAAPPRLVVMTPAPRPAPVPQQSVQPQPAVEVAPKAGPQTVGPALGSAPASAGAQGLTPVQPAKPARKAAKPPPRIEPPADPGALEKLVAAAKGYRPLYHHLEAQIRRAIPGAVVAARDRYVAVGAPLELAAITLHPTEIRLGLALGDHPFDAPLEPARLRGPGPGITHMVVLTDARQVNDALLGLLKSANARVNADGGTPRA